jgi:hypothetical protein
MCQAARTVWQTRAGKKQEQAEQQRPEGLEILKNPGSLGSAARLAPVNSLGQFFKPFDDLAGRRDWDVDLHRLSARP